ncbi:C-type lectin lectoxin-Lio3-like [Haliotis rufescens]|uniref:C-type lectin lectoxin-Lio3-like n=1 Tax=Haliotis rufescens TaxID=6454 RepID=UPI00201F3E7D|nr:C-type lectin lectoxin-Lio3-like [Haliotis rufescens]
MTSLLDCPLVLLLLCLANQAKGDGLAIRLPQFDNKLMTTYLINSYSDAFSLTWCAVKCYNALKCGSFFYNKGDKSCKLHSVLFITPGDAAAHPGSWYFQMTEARCPNDAGYVLHRSPVLCYKVHMEKQTYDQAKVTCQTEAATLLKVKDADISFHMFEFLRASSAVRETHYTIGADDFDVQGQYKWGDGDIATWTNWASTEPSSPTERCLALAWFFYFKWNDIPCTEHMSFICQIDGV